MRRSRLFSWLMATSPLTLLLWLAVTGRFNTNAEFPTRPDPPGFENALEAYIPFVQEAKKLPTIYSSRVSAQLEKVLETADTTFPQVLPTQLEDNFRDDLLRPIIESQNRVITLTTVKHRGLIAANRPDEAVLTLGKALRLTQMLCIGDSGANSRSTALATIFLEQIEESLGQCKEETLALLTTELLKQESRRPDLLRAFKNDVILLSIAAATRKNGVTMDEAKWASETLQEISNGKPIGESLKRLRKWKPGSDTTRMWEMLIGWNLMIKNENNLRRKKELLFAKLRAILPPAIATNSFAGQAQLVSTTRNITK